MTMVAKRVDDEHGSHIEPPLQEGWDHLTKLQWHAAVVRIDAGLEVSVHTGTVSREVEGSWVPIPDTFSVWVNRSTAAGALGFHEAWAFLNGLEAGARAERYRRRRENRRTLGISD